MPNLFKMMDAQISNASIKDSEEIAAIIHAAYREVAEKYPDSSRPSSPYPLICTGEWISRTMARGAEYFLLRQCEQSIGCAALIKITSDVLFMDRLAVQPQFRRAGWGRRLVRFCLETAQKRGVKRLETGVPSDLTDLIEWFRSLGFRFKQLARFNELPFTVAFMYFDLKEFDYYFAEEETEPLQIIKD